MGARVPDAALPVQPCSTLSNRYRHFRLEWVTDRTICRRVIGQQPASEHRPICPECRSTLRYLNRHRPEGRVDTLAALNR